MENKKLGLDPMFPVLVDKVNHLGRCYQYQEQGISKRLYIATQCQSTAEKFFTDTTVGYISQYLGIEASEYVAKKHYPEAVAKMAFQLADELLKQENL
jgi:hypothetical protein